MSQGWSDVPGYFFIANVILILTASILFLISQHHWAIVVGICLTVGVIANLVSYQDVTSWKSFISETCQGKRVACNHCGHCNTIFPWSL